MQLKLILILVLCFSFSFTKANEVQNYQGKIGNYDVVVHLEFKTTQVTGFYYYEKIGVNIPLEGSIEGKKLVLNELNYQSQKVATFNLNYFKNNQLQGSWNKNQSSQRLIVNLFQTPKPIPDFPEHLVGSYKNTSDCNLKIDIFMQKGNYYYNLKSDTRIVTGKLSFSRSLEEQVIYLTLTELEWEDYKGELDENGNSKFETSSKPIGIQGLIDGNELTFQNYGNAMNYYIKFGECGEKFLHLEKIRK